MGVNILLVATDQPRATPPNAVLDQFRYLRDDVADLLLDTVDPGRQWFVTWPDGPPTSFCRCLTVTDGVLATLRTQMLQPKISPVNPGLRIGMAHYRIDIGFGLPAGKRAELYGGDRRTFITNAQLQAAIIFDTIDRSRADAGATGGAMVFTGSAF